MKKILFAFAALMGSMIAVQAQVANDQETQQSSEAVTTDPQTQDAQDAEDVAPADNAQGIQENQDADQSERAGDVATEDRAMISTDELPEAIKQSLEDQEYKGWIINSAHHNKKEDVYEVELKNGAETKTVKFDQDGKKVE